jgi:AcrR family transcriptional regulator
MSTKQKIFEASIKSFNDYGVANVRLQQIADECGISVGNLAYHFKNKEAIVNFVYDQLFQEFSYILSEYLIEESFIGINNNLSKFYPFFMQYKFFFTDIFEIERNYPTIIKNWHQFSNKLLSQLKSRIDYDIMRGSLVAQSDEMNELLASNIWMSIVFWMPQRILRGQPIELKLFKEAVWSQIIPYLSQKGQDEFVALIYPTLV